MFTVEFFDPIANITIKLPPGWKVTDERSGDVGNDQDKSCTIIGPTGRWIARRNGKPLRGHVVSGRRRGNIRLFRSVLSAIDALSG